MAGTATDDHLQERKQEKTLAIDAIEETLATIERHGREPDLWERFFLVQAIGMLFRGGYTLASVDAQLALVPEGKRSPAGLSSDAIYGRYDLRMLKAALVEAVAEPVRAFPLFGPVIFTEQRSG